MKLLKFYYFFVLFIYYLPNVAFSHSGLMQENPISIELGETNISIERPFTISVILKNSETRPTITFPDIKGFTKRGRETSVTTNLLNGKSIVSQIITQNYLANKTGQYELPAFTLTIDETSIRSEGATITVRAATTPPGSATAQSSSTAPQSQSISVPGPAFLSLSTSKNAVYVGEGFTVKLALFVAETYPFELSFYELEQQLQQLLKKLRPTNCWEENAGIAEVQSQPVTLNGKRFTEYRIYQATFFPLNKQPIQFPTAALQMVRFKPAATPGGKRIKEIVPFASKPLSIAVRALPPHPLNDRVPVGQYRLFDYVSRRNPAVGQSVQYDLRIDGEGNIASLPAPNLPQHAGLDIFPPEESTSINRSGGTVRGYKRFRYLLVPRQNGVFPLKKLFQFIYFDPQRNRYDTLYATQRIQVGGISTTAEDTVQVSLPGSIYTGIEKISSTNQPLNPQELIRIVANVLIMVMILGTIYLLWKK